MTVGIRIMATDSRLRGALCIVPHPTRVIGGRPKEYHLRLDGEASVMVSEVVWRRVQEIMAVNPDVPRFIEVGQTRRPPTQVVDSGIDTKPVFRFTHGNLNAVGDIQMRRITTKG